MVLQSMNATDLGVRAVAQHHSLHVDFFMLQLLATQSAIYFNV